MSEPPVCFVRHGDEQQQHQGPRTCFRSVTEERLGRHLLEAAEREAVVHGRGGSFLAPAAREATLPPSLCL